MRKKRIKGFTIVTVFALIWLIAILIIFFNELLKNNKETELIINSEDYSVITTEIHY